MEVFVFISLLLLAAESCNGAPTPVGEFKGFPQLSSIVGSHQELGHKIGSQFREGTRAYMGNDSFFNDKAVPYNGTEEGAAVYRDMLAAVNKTFPQYLDELAGLADGLGLSFSTVFLWNIRFEISQLLGGPQFTGSCSDLYVRGGEVQAAMGHNEDGEVGYLDKGYKAFVVDAKILSANGLMPLESFTAFCYPGELCGNAFGFSRDKRVVHTMNTLYPKNINPKAIGRNFVNRAMIAVPYPEMADFLQKTPCSSGFSLNIGDLGSLNVSNFEVSVDGVVHTTYENGSGYHFNQYMHSKVGQDENLSTDHRLRRVKEMKPPQSIKDIKVILGDTEDKDFPIFRSGTPPDEAATLATAVYDLQKKMMWIYHGNPADQTATLTLSMAYD